MPGPAKGFPALPVLTAAPGRRRCGGLQWSLATEVPHLDAGAARPGLSPGGCQSLPLSDHSLLPPGLAAQNRTVLSGSKEGSEPHVTGATSPGGRQGHSLCYPT